jgi:hypothetical protein
MFVRDRIFVQESGRYACKPWLGPILSIRYCRGVLAQIWSLRSLGLCNLRISRKRNWTNMKIAAGIDMWVVFCRVKAICHQKPPFLASCSALRAIVLSGILGHILLIWFVVVAEPVDPRCESRG